MPDGNGGAGGSGGAGSQGDNDRRRRGQDDPHQADWRPRPDPTSLTTQQLGSGLGNLREIIEARLDAMDTATRILAERLAEYPGRIEQEISRRRDDTDREIRSLRDLLEGRLRVVETEQDRCRREVPRLATEMQSDRDREILALRELLESRIDGMDRATQLLAEQVSHIPSDLDRAIAAIHEHVAEKFQSALAETRRTADVGTEKFTAIEGTFASNALALTAALAAQKEAACMQADELVLCADLIWRPAGILVPGDSLVAFEEEPSVPTGRRYCTATVTQNSLHPDSLIRVVTSAGSVRCNPDHPWLVGGGTGHPWHWVETRKLRPGQHVLHMLDVWEADLSWNAGWLAGILDGEGCLGFKSRRNGSAKLSIGQVDGITADMIDEALKETGTVVLRHTRPAQAYSRGSMTGHAQEQRRWEINGRADIMRILGTFRPARMLANSDQVWEGFAIRSGMSRASRVKVIAVDPAGTGMVARLSTSTRTYIGAGFAMHNSEQNKSNTLAITKSEQATKETISANAAQTQTGLKSLEATFADMKERLVRIESAGAGAAGQRTEHRADQGTGISIIMAVLVGVSVLVGVISLVIALKK